MQKCAPSPLTTAALTPSGRLMKQVCSCWIKVSLMALRLAGRFSRTGNTAPDCEIRNKSSVASKPETGGERGDHQGVFANTREFNSFYKL